jgi:myosin heavy subunit
MVKDKFMIVHTPKEVTYYVNGFRAKNKDEISKDIEKGVTSSDNEYIVRIWKNLLPGESPDESK